MNLLKVIPPPVQTRRFQIEIDAEELLLIRSALGQLSSKQVVDYERRLKGIDRIYEKSQSLFISIDDLANEHIKDGN